MIRAKVNVLIVRTAVSSVLCCFSGFGFVAIYAPHQQDITVRPCTTFSNWGMAKEFGVRD
jgi:hypothetical protein